MDIKAVFFDFDFTLYSHKKKCIPDSAKEALKALHEKGIKIFLATGRNTVEMSLFPEYRDIPFDGFVMLNGQICLDGSNNIVFENPFKGKALDSLLKLFNEKKMPILFVEENKLYINYDSPIVYEATKDIACVQHTVGSYTGNPLYLAVAYITQEEEESLHKILPDTSFQRWGKQGVDIVAKGMDKTKGIQFFLDKYSIRRDQTMVFGDSFNDVKMIEYAQIGIAMGNAVKETKDSADFVTKDIDDDGLAFALKYYNLI